MENLLEVTGLSKEYTGFKLRDVGFSLPAGYIMGFIGPNGAGKTTTIKLILNMIEKDGGTAKICGLDSVLEEERVKEQVGVVFDSCYFPSKWDCLDVERAMALFYSRWDREMFLDWLGKFGISREKKVGELSRGTQMKLMLSCAFSHAVSSSGRCCDLTLRVTIYPRYPSWRKIRSIWTGVNFAPLWVRSPRLFSISAIA